MLINVNTQTGDAGLVREVVKEHNPDILVLQEVNAQWVQELAWLTNSLPYSHVEAREDNFGIGVFSKPPMTGVKYLHIGDAHVPSLLATISVDQGLLHVLATHPVPPVGPAYSHWRNRQLAEMPSHVDASVPFLLIGDLNVSPWNHNFTTLLRQSGLLDSARGHGVQPTWPSSNPLLRIPLDHCLHSPSITVVDRKIGAGVSSDHYPLIVDFCLPAATGVQELSHSDYTQICSAVSDFHAAVKARHMRTLRRVSPLVAFSVQEGIVDLGRMADSFATQGNRAGKVQRVVPGGADALAFTGGPGAEESGPWYYVQLHDRGNWVVQFCEDWPVDSIPDLFDECRSVARKAATAQSIRAMENALTILANDCGRLPSEEEGLEVLLNDPGLKGWNGPYLHLEALIDPWGTAFRYELSNGQPRITSAGRDRQHDTSDDVHLP
jgi:endonuclease/exonuclease/phosphatase family metal-dependent hydrolase